MSECSCIYVGDYDGPSMHSKSHRKARKTHQCSECERNILPGEEYEYVFGVWAGDTNQFKTCLDCLSVRDSFFCEGIVYGGIWELVPEHILELNGEVSSDCIVPLTPRAREIICELIEEQWRIWDDDED